jgi:hypothetical protein
MSKTSQKNLAAAAVATVLVLRTCNAELKAHNDFQWPEAGGVEAPDFDPKPVCGYGLHGLLWGEGDGGLLNWDSDAKWLVVAVPADSIVSLDDGAKVKFPRGEVVYCGSRGEATAYIAERHPGGSIVGHTAQNTDNGSTVNTGYGGTSTSGDYGKSTSGTRGTSTSGTRGTSTSGDYGKSTSGDYGKSTSGYGGTSTSGACGTSTSGYGGTSTSGDGGTSTSGDYGKSTSGYGGTSTSGTRGTSTSGYGGTSTSGEGGILVLRWFDGVRDRLVVRYVGEDGIKPDTIYKLDDKGQIVEVGPKPAPVSP